MDKRILSEIDLLPNGIKSTPAKTAWEALSNGLVNIQQAMKYRETERIPDARSAENGRRHVITPKDVEEIVGYIKTTVNNCLSSTLPNLMLKESKSNTSMKKNKTVVRLTESQLKQMIAESVKKVLKEWNSDDDFICHGCKAWSNWGGIEMQISDGGDEARLRYPDGEITDWLEIEYDEEGVAYITAPNGEIERFDEYERVR